MPTDFPANFHPVQEIYFVVVGRGLMVMMVSTFIIPVFKSLLKTAGHSEMA